MKRLRQILFLERIYMRQTIAQILYVYCLWGGIAAIAVFFYVVEEGDIWPLIALVIVLALLALRSGIRFVIVERRMMRTQEHIEQRKNVSQIGVSAVSNELNYVDNTRVLREGPGWVLYDAVFEFMTKTKNSQFLGREMYYTVFEAELQRTVPHLIFDSRSGKRRQFKNIYLQSQRISLEGNFDRYFDMYSPEHYQIDTLSFITPEVMQAMLSLKQYDIELINGKVLCYAPLLDPADFDEFVRVCAVLAAEINDNIGSYRDGRLQGDDRKTTVTPYARALLESPRRHMPTFILATIAAIAFVGAAIYFRNYQIALNEYALLTYIVSGTSGYKIWRIMSKNKHLQRQYEVLYVNGRPSF